MRRDRPRYRLFGCLPALLAVLAAGVALVDPRLALVILTGPIGLVIASFR